MSKLYYQGEAVSSWKLKPRKRDIARGIWAALWVIPFAAIYMLLMIIAFIGFGRNVMKDTVRDFK
jgi:hypothetical protein